MALPMRLTMPLPEEEEDELEVSSTSYVYVEYRREGRDDFGRHLYRHVFVTNWEVVPVP